MDGNTVKGMTTNFGKLDKFEGHDFRRWQKKMHFVLTTLKVVYVLTTPMPELLEDATVEAIRIRSLAHRGISKTQDSDKGKGKEVSGPSVNMTEEGKNKYNKQNKGKKRSNENNSGSSSNKKPKLECWKCGKTGHFKRDCQSGNKKNTNVGGSGRGLRTIPKTKDDAIAWWIDSGATTHVYKDRRWFKTYEPVEDGSVLYMGDDHFAPVHRKGSVVLEFSSGKSITLFNVLYVPKLRKNLISGRVLNKCGYKKVYESDKYILSKCGVFVGFGYYNNGAVPYTPQQNGMAERKNIALKEMVNSMLSYSSLSEGFRGEALVVVRLPDPKRKTFGEKGIDCIFVGYADHFKAYRFYIIETNDSVSINSIIESRDSIFDENRFSSIPRPKDIIPNSDESQRDDHYDDVPNEIPEPRKGKRVQKAKSYGYDFQLYLVEGSKDQVGLQYSYCYSIEEDLRTYNEAMQSQDYAFWKEAIGDEIGSIMENNTWVLSDLPPCFRQKEGIDYFDTYASVSHMTTIRLLLALAAIHNLVIHQMDVKTTFLNGDLEAESVYETTGRICYSGKFDDSDKGVIICLYVDDMLIFGTDQNQVDRTKKFLSSKFSMKDMREADVILGIKIKRENKGIVITQSHYIEKIFKKFNREDCSPVSTLMDPVEKLKLNTSKLVDQLKYSRAIGFLMYDMTCTRPDIAYVIVRLSRLLVILVDNIGKQ
nr:hypothetical protein [Tanacetum cinerariifolium]GEV79900.1 hypothetical protein [Tanacetum cinerariifolium]GEW09232.1 hypothetical protein [Tanacetum cinerariifolium]